MKLPKILILSCFVFALANRGVLAYSGDNSIQKWEDDVYGMPTEYNSPSFNHETLKNLEKSAINQIFGATQEQYQTMSGSGAIASIGNLIAGLYSNPPASSVTYFADVLHNLGLAKPAYAQGIGFSGLSNLLPLWKASRNLAYIAFVVVFLYMGLAIMLRIKLDPKTVVTIQNAIPKLVIGLVLVTFSYAIVGLMIDLIYVLIYLGVLAIGQTGWIDVAKEQAKFSNLSFGGGLRLLFGAGWKTLNSVLGGVLGTVFSEIALFVVGALVTGGNIAVGAAAATLPTLIIGIIALFCIFKLFFALIGCYISIIISLIAGPVQIMLGVIPGNQGGFGSWFKNLLANILVFPAVALTLLLGWLLSGSHGPTWTPPVISTSGKALTGILGFGMLLLLPKIPDIIKNAFKMKPAGYGAAIGEPFQAAYKVGMAGYKAYQERAPSEIQKRAKKEGEYKAHVQVSQEDKYQQIR